MGQEEVGHNHSVAFSPMHWKRFSASRHDHQQTSQQCFEVLRPRVHLSLLKWQLSLLSWAGRWRSRVNRNPGPLFVSTQDPFTARIDLF